MNEEDFKIISEFGVALQEILPEGADEIEVARIIGCVLASYGISDVKDVAFICQTAGAWYSNFLAGMQEGDENIH